LLHLLAIIHHPQLPELRALHIDHGLHPDSAKWARHCADKAQALGMAFESIKVTVDNINELGLEAAARQARYHAFRFDLAEGEVLLTAQHQQDQAETLLLQLLRGAGPTGLSAMWPESDLDGLTIIRPLLSVSKAHILDYAQLHQLDWIEDPSNSDSTLNRNYLRNEIWPFLEKRWPSVTQTLSRSAAHCRETVALMQALAELDAGTVCNDDLDRLSVKALMSLPEPRQRNLLRYVIEQNGLSLPSTAVLQRIIDEVCKAAEDKSPLVTWPGAEVRRYRDSLHIDFAQTETGELGEIKLQGTGDVRLADNRVLKWRLMSGQGLKENVVNGRLTLKFREGGERIRLQGHSQHKSLKQLFQEWSVPPWQRQQIPLLFVEHELVGVVGYGYAEHYAADIGEKGWLPYLVEPDFH
jgi:tRNA(Ile)-lysidine synthase